MGTCTSGIDQVTKKYVFDLMQAYVYEWRAYWILKSLAPFACKYLKRQIYEQDGDFPVDEA